MKAPLLPLAMLLLGLLALAPSLVSAGDGTSAGPPLASAPVGPTPANAPAGPPPAGAPAGPPPVDGPSRAAPGFADWKAKADAGDPEAQCNVGVFYLNGQSVPQDFVQGMVWLARSSDQGFAYARFVLADVYSRGFGENAPDMFRAYYYGSLAAASSDLPPRYRERAIKLRDLAVKKLTADEVAEAQRQAATARMQPPAKQP